MEGHPVERSEREEEEERAKIRFRLSPQHQQQRKEPPPSRRPSPPPPPSTSPPPRRSWREGYDSMERDFSRFFRPKRYDQINRYNDVIVNGFDLPWDNYRCEYHIQEQIRRWRRARRSGAWLTLPYALSHHIPMLLRNGFVPHHCEPDLLVLTIWLADDGIPRFPAYGTHNLRVEAIVINRQGQVAMVLEKYSRFGDDFKLPSGSVDAGEFISDAAVREVREELGIEVEFDRLVGVANRVSAKFGRNEVVACCLMRCLGEEVLTPDPNELSDAKWMDVNEAERCVSKRATGLLEQQWFHKLQEDPELVKSFTEKPSRDFRGPPTGMRILC